MNTTFVLQKIKNQLIVSSQAAVNEPLYNENAMNALISTIVELGGIDVLRLAGARDISNTKKRYPDTIVIGITKPDTIPENYKELVYITPTKDSALNVIEAGADIVAFDGTVRNKNVKEIIDLIHKNNRVAMADIATFEDAKYSSNLGADIISTTLSGYTKETENNPHGPDFKLLKRCISEICLPVILEGKVWEPCEIKHGFELGAHSVVVGSAITRPHKIIERFKKEI